MVIYADRSRFWKGWREHFRRLGIIIPAALMVTLLLIAIDWTPLRTLHIEWLLTVATVLLVLLWAGIAVALLATGAIALALRADRIELHDGRLHRHLLLSPDLEVLVEGATMKRQSLTIVVRGASKGRVVIPQLFYAPQDLERLFAAARLAENKPDSTTPTD